MEEHQDFELEEAAEQINILLPPPQNLPAQVEGNTPIMKGERKRIFVDRTGTLLAMYMQGDFSDQTMREARTLFVDEWSGELERIHGHWTSKEPEKDYRKRRRERDNSLRALVYQNIGG